MTVQDRALNTAEAARFLGLKKGTLDVWRSIGRTTQPPYQRIGSRITYRLADLKEFVERQTIGGAADTTATSPCNQ